MIFKRKITDEIRYWKDNLSNDFALLIEGARRVGKTTIVKEFVKNNYESYIIVDFTKELSKVKDAIENFGSFDLDGFFLELQRIYRTELIKGKSVIVFDEVQLCKDARQMIKHLVADGRYHYIETGSLISIRQNIEDILIPSEEYSITMYPMDFEEFLWAKSDRITMDFVRRSFASRKPMGRNAHRDTMRLFRQYMLTGGMPRVIEALLKDNNYDSVEQQKKSILSLYKKDLGKLRYSSEKCIRVFSKIPGLLSKHDKTFKSNYVKRYSRIEDYVDAVNSLEESKTVNVCKRCTDPGPAPGLNEDEYGFKIYMADTGLLFTAAFNDNIGSRNEIYEMILKDKMKVNNGMFFENVVAQELVASGHGLYFSRFRTEETVNTQEVDFIVSKNGMIIPIDVKSGESSKHVSLDRFCKKYAKRISESYVVHTKDLRIDDKGVIYVPAYMVSLIGKDQTNAPMVGASNLSIS